MLILVPLSIFDQGEKTLRSKNRRWLTAAVATVGAGALTFGGAVLPAAAAETHDEPVALNASADKYELAAAHTGGTAETVKADEAAGLISVSEEGFVLFIDDAHSHDEGFSLFAAAAGAPIPGTPAAGSRPGAPVTVYLDFDGETLEGTHWNTDSGIASLVFTAATGVNEHDVWAAVAEDYAPFNVNVTTTRPSDEALYKSSVDDDVYGSHVIITDSYDEVLPAATGSSGIAWLGGTGSEYLSGALVFTEGTSGSSKALGEIASHESGHNFGLEHDGTTASADGEYYVPTDGVWGTIMGAAYVVPVSQWSAGAYAGATNNEDDLSIITNRAAAGAVFIGATTSDGTPYTDAACIESGDPGNPQPGDVFYALGVNGDCNPPGEQLILNFSYSDRADFAADEVGNSAADAQALDNASGSFEAASVIERTADVDVFAVTTVGGELTATVEVADISPNLDAKLTVTDSAGVVVTEDDPAATRQSASVAAGLGATVTANVKAGTYYITVDGVGTGDPDSATADNANGYTEYGSLGNYSLSGTAEPFVTEAIVIETPADGVDVTGGSDVDVTGTATPNATVVLTVGGATVDTVTADANGDWAGTVKANQYGDTEIVASQSIDGIAIPGTASVTVTAPPAPVAAPVITVPADGTSTEDSTPTVSGTGAAGATVTVTVTDADGAVVTADVVVADNGTWSLDLTAELANGDYTVVAAQTLAGVTSDDSAAVAFTVAVPAGSGNNGSGGGNGGNGGDDDNGDNLATTGSDFNVAPFAAAAGALLLVGAGFAGYARRKSLSLDS